MKENELSWERVRAASYRNERELRKTITTLNSDLSCLSSRNSLLTSEKEFEVAEAVKEARRDERQACSSRLKEQRSLVHGLEKALAAETDAKQVSRPLFWSRTRRVRSAVAAPMRRMAPLDPRPCFVFPSRTRIRVATPILLSMERRNNMRRRIHARRATHLHPPSPLALCHLPSPHCRLAPTKASRQSGGSAYWKRHASRKKFDGASRTHAPARLTCPPRKSSATSLTD